MQVFPRLYVKFYRLVSIETKRPPERAFRAKARFRDFLLFVIENLFVSGGSRGRGSAAYAEVVVMQYGVEKQ